MIFRKVNWMIRCCKTVLLLGLINMYACSSTSFRDGLFRDQEACYEVGKLEGPWQFLGVEKGKKKNDLAWIQKETGVIIQANATCKNISEGSLSALARQLWIGFRNVEILSQKEIDVDFADGYRVDLKATFEGVPLRFVFYLFRKSGCLYDLSLFGKEQYMLQEEITQFENFALTFQPR